MPIPSFSPTGFCGLPSLLPQIATNKTPISEDIRPASVFLTVGYDVPYNCCYMAHSRSGHRRPCLPICSPGCFKLSALSDQTLPIEHKNASYMVRRIFSSKRHWRAIQQDLSKIRVNTTNRWGHAETLRTDNPTYPSKTVKEKPR